MREKAAKSPACERLLGVVKARFGGWRRGISRFLHTRAKKLPKSADFCAACSSDIVDLGPLFGLYTRPVRPLGIPPAASIVIGRVRGAWLPSRDPFSHPFESHPAQPEKTRETDLPTQRSRPQTPPWFPCPQGNESWPLHLVRTSVQGSQAPFCLVLSFRTLLANRMADLGRPSYCRDWSFL